MLTPAEPSEASVSTPVEAELRERLRFETFLADLAAGFQGLSTEALDDAITEALKRLVEVLDMDRSTALELAPDGASLRITHGYARAGIQPPEFGRNLAQMLPWYAEQVRQGRTLVLFRLPDDIPPEAREEREYTTLIDMRSHVLLPLVVGREIVGCLGIAAFGRSREFPASFLPRLGLVASVLASALYRKRASRSRVSARWR